MKITSVGENVEKLEPLCTVDGNVKWCSCCGKEYGGLSKSLIVELSYDPVVLGIYPKELKAGSEEIFVYPCSEQHYSPY